ncbi:MAG: helix-turn-helix domain-containing protein [Oscillospiraceae bacterium]
MKEKIRELRRLKSWTQVDLANMLNVTQVSVSQWETGRSYPDHEMLTKIADLFGVTTDYLLGRTDYYIDPANPNVQIFPKTNKTEVVRFEKTKKEPATDEDSERNMVVQQIANALLEMSDEELLEARSILQYLKSKRDDKTP